MTVKMLTDRRGPLQGVSVEAIVRNAYGPDARFMPDTGDSIGLIVAPDEDDDGSMQELDSVIEVHETDG